jgi:hypothetical protein
VASRRVHLTVNSLKAILTTANQQLPWLKEFVPNTVRRQLLLRILGVLNDFTPPPSRLWLERHVLPALPPAGFRRILFVGTAPYTWHYERIVAKAGGEWVTADIRQANRVWGSAKEHLTARIQDISHYFPRGRFDCVIVNGVFGFGVNTESDIAKSLDETRRVLRSGGVLLIGWNTDLIADPMKLAGKYGRSDTRLFPERRVFEHETHVYDFLVARPEPQTSIHVQS